MHSIHPGLFLILAGLVMAACPKKLRQILVVLCPAVAFGLCATLPVGTVITMPFITSFDLVLVSVSGLNRIMMIAFSLIGLVAAIYSAHVDNRLETFASMTYLGSTLGTTLAGDWLTLLVFWELMAVTSVLLIWSKRSEMSRKAGFRYLVMHMFGGNMMLFGVAIKLFQGQFLVDNIVNVKDLSFWLILIAVCVNAAAVPLHSWVPDAYPEASETASVFNSFLTTKLAALCMVRIFAGYEALVILGVVMIFYGSFYALLENDIKRLLSYHIIAQVGYMVADAGLGGEMGINASLAITYSNVIYKSLLFMCVGAVIYATGTRKLNQLGGLAKKMPLVCICFFIAAFSIAGAPPLAGFTCKSLSIVAAEEAHREVLFILMMSGSVATALSIPFKLGYFIFFGKNRDLEVKPIPLNMKVALVAGAAICVFTGFCPNIIYGWLPFEMDYNPYTFAHILEYVQLFPAALLPFLINLDIMEPHTALTLDLDWFARKPMKHLLSLISDTLVAGQRFFGGIGKRIYTGVQVASGDPYRLIGVKPLNQVGSDDPSEQVRPDQYRIKIGMGMTTIAVMVIVIALAIMLL